jgi:hypothetical protein
MSAAVQTGAAEAQIDLVARVNGWTEQGKPADTGRRWRCWTRDGWTIRVQFTGTGGVIHAYACGPDGDWHTLKFPRRAAILRALLAVEGVAR